MPRKTRTGLIPAYGRDYRSQAEIIADLKADKDFTVSDWSMGREDGRYCNLTQLREIGIKVVEVRYHKLREQCTIKLEDIPDENRDEV